METPRHISIWILVLVGVLIVAGHRAATADEPEEDHDPSQAREIEVEIHTVPGSGITEQQIREWLDEANEIWKCSYKFEVVSVHVQDGYDNTKNDEGKLNIWGLSQKTWKNPNVSGFRHGNEIQLVPGDDDGKIKDNTLAHEIGHYLGLGHPDAGKDPNNIMYPDQHGGVGCNRTGSKNPEEMQAKARESKRGRAQKSKKKGNGKGIFDPIKDVLKEIIDIFWAEMWTDCQGCAPALHLGSNVLLLDASTELGFYLESDGSPLTGEPLEGLDYYVAYRAASDSVVFHRYDAAWVPLNPAGITCQRSYAWEDADVPPIPVGVSLKLPLALLDRRSGNQISFRAVAHSPLHVETDVAPDVGLATITVPQCFPDQLSGVDVGGPLPMGSIAPCSPPVCDFVITAGGADIWDPADQFFYALPVGADIPASGNFTAVVRVDGMEPPGANDWAKAGIMVRESFDAGSPHAMVIRSLTMGAALQGRDAAGAGSWNIGLPGSYAPDEAVWLRLDRTGDTVTGSYAVGGDTLPTVWTAAVSHQIVLPPDAHIGLATTSHDQGVPITVRYSRLCIGPYGNPPVILSTVLPGGVPGGDGYMGIREVIDNAGIGDQAACYASLNSGAGTIVDYTAPVINIEDGGGNGNYGNDDVFGVVTAGHRGYGAVDDMSLLARGVIHIPSGEDGQYTFGVNSDDGFTLQLPGNDFCCVVNGEIADFQSGAALRFYGGRAAADTLGAIRLSSGDHPFWLTYHETSGGAAVELYAAEGYRTAFDPAVFRLIGHKSIGTVPIPGLCSNVTMTASWPGSWSGGQVLSLKNAAAAVAEGPNSIGMCDVVNHSDPDDGTADPDLSGFRTADLAFPNSKVGDDNDFGVVVKGEIEIPAAGKYQLGFNSDDGASLQIYGQTWNSIVADATGNAAIAGDQLINDSLTGWSFTAGEIEFSVAGCYGFEAVMFERDGGSFFELFGRGVSPTSGLPDPAWHLLKVGGAAIIDDPDGLQLVGGECFPSTNPAYNGWVAMGKPNCWCEPYQCDGDADGAAETFFKYRIYGKDLGLIVDNWKRKIGDPLLDPCADIDHKSETFFQYRVYGNDLSTVVSNWKKKDPDLAADCPRPE